MRKSVLDNNLEKTKNDLAAQEAKVENEAPAIINVAKANATITRANADAIGISIESRVKTIRENLKSLTTDLALTNR